MDNEEVIDAELIDGNLALSVITSAEIDRQIATAKNYPRSLKEFKRKAMELATLDQETAESMFYTLVRGGKKIEGPSIRMAEVVANCWGNMRSESDIVAIDDKFVTAMGTAMDLESNTAARIRVKRRITNKEGRRFNDDMIAITCNAACSIANREAIFKVVPRALFKDIYLAARATAVGGEKTLKERRERAVTWFKEQGATEKQVLDLLGRKGTEEITLDDLATLTGLKTAIVDGEVTIKSAFALDTTTAKEASKGTKDLNKALKGKPTPEPQEESSATPDPDSVKSQGYLIVGNHILASEDVTQIATDVLEKVISKKENQVGLTQEDCDEIVEEVAKRRFASETKETGE